ncbi:hypothetical protein OIO90_004317 [Microbotryomycetes sp. JL221]|nr:hypothetical protein OIO90_004317 [Microbotryomycetes sp. JL221]
MAPASQQINWNPPAVLSKLISSSNVNGSSANSTRSATSAFSTRLDDQSPTEGPATHWEVAYVYAFLTRFTEWRTLDGPLPDVTVFEQELINSSPEQDSNLIKTIPPPRGSNNHYILPWQLPSNDIHFQLGLKTCQTGQPGALVSGGAVGTYVGPSGEEGEEEGEEMDDEVLQQDQDELNLPPLPTTNGFGSSDVQSDMNNRETTTTTTNETNGDTVVQDEQHSTTWSTWSWGKLTEQDLKEQGGLPTKSLLLIEIIKSFERYLYLPEFEQSHGRRDWFSWLVRFVNKRLNSFGKGGFYWQHNLLKRVGVKSGSEREQEFWLLSWQDKIHLLRQMVDFQLTNVKPIRKIIDEAYDIGKQRVTKRGDSNELIIDSLGKIDSRTIWKIDDSPRIYASTDPYLSSDVRDVENSIEFEWQTISTTLEGYKQIIKNLPEPDWKLLIPKMMKCAEDELIEEMLQQATEVAQTKSNKKPLKKKQKLDDSTSGGSTPNATNDTNGTDSMTKANLLANMPKPEITLNPITGRPNVTIAQAMSEAVSKQTKGQKAWSEQSKEALTRARLEEELPDVLEFQKGLEQCSTKKLRDLNRAQSKDFKLARNLSLNQSSFSRSSRSQRNSTRSFSYNLNSNQDNISNGSNGVHQDSSNGALESGSEIGSPAPVTTTNYVTQSGRTIKRGRKNDDEQQQQHSNSLPTPVVEQPLQQVEESEQGEVEP